MPFARLVPVFGPQKWHFGWPNQKGRLAIAKLKPLSLFISLLLMLKRAFDNVKRQE